MITIIHGENLKESRNYFWEIRQKAKNPISLMGENINLFDLMQLLNNGGFFEDVKQIFIENIFSLKKKEEKEKIIELLLKKEKENEIVFFESKEITPANLKIFKNASVKKFDIPKIIFAFLDLIGIDKKKSIELFHEILKTNDAEYVFFMLIRHFRIMLALSENSDNQIDELKRIQPWQKGKYLTQLKKIGVDKVKKFYSDLFQTDFKQKTGQNALSLIQTIDIFLLRI